MQKDFSLPKIHQRQITETNYSKINEHSSLDLHSHFQNMSSMSRYPGSTKNRYGKNSQSTLSQEFNSQIKQIDDIETKMARMTPVNIEQLERDIKILKQPIVLNNLNNLNDQHHVWLQEDTTINLELLKKQRKYCKFTLKNSYPLKIKASSQDGNKFGVFISFTEPFPDETMDGSDIYSYPNRSDHLYKFHRPKIDGNHMFITFRSEEFIKINVKYWFSDKKQEIERQKRYEDYMLKHKTIVVKGPRKIKQVDKKEETERQKQIFDEQVQYIIEKRKEQNKKYFNINVIERNRQIADNLEIYKQKKVIDTLMHDIKCEEVYRRNVNTKLMNYQQNVSKIISRSIQKEMSYKINQRKKYMDNINKITRVWLTLYKLVQLSQISDEKLKIRKLSNLFIHKKKQFAKNLKEKFNSNRDKRFNTRQPKIIHQIEGYNGVALFANIVKKKSKKRAVNILVQSIHGIIMNSLINKLKEQPIVFLSKVKYVQKFLRQRKKMLRDRVLVLLEIILKKMVEEGEANLTEKEIQYKDCLQYLSDFRYGHKLEIVLRYLRIQSERFKKSFKVYHGDLEAQQDDYITYKTVMKKSEAKEQNLEILQELEPSQKNVQQFINRNNIKSIYQAMDEIKKEQKQLQKQGTSQEDLETKIQDQKLVVVYKTKIREPQLFIFRDRNNLKQYILYALRQIQVEQKRIQESEEIQQSLQKEKEEQDQNQKKSNNQIQ